MPGLRYMPPVPTLNGLLQCGSGDAEPLRQLSVSEAPRSVQLSGGLNYLWRQLGLSLTLNKFRALTVFAYHVVKVVFLAAQEQMGRVYAMANVAFMQNEKSFRDLSEGDFPHEAVCTNGLTVLIKFAVTATRSGLNSASPKPAGVGFPHFRPEDFDQRAARLARFGAGPTLNGRAIGFFAIAVVLRERLRFLAATASSFVYYVVSHDVNLLERFQLWSGSFGWTNTRAGRFVFYH